MTASNFLGSDSYVFTLIVISKWFIRLHTIGVNSKCGCPGAPPSFLPGSKRQHSTGTQYLLGAQVSWLCQLVCVTLVAVRHFAFLILLVSYCNSGGIKYLANLTNWQDFVKINCKVPTIRYNYL